MNDEQFLVLVAMIASLKNDIASLNNEVASLKNELARLHQVGVEVDEKLGEMNKIGRKISKKL